VRLPAIRSAFAITAITVAFSTMASSMGAQTNGPASSPARIAPDSERTALTRELLELMRVGPAMLQGLEIGLASQKATNPNIPEVFWTEFAARARRDVPKFVESVLPVYASRFSAQELRQYIAFYRTPAGRHLADEGGSISAELMRAGQRWGVELGADTMKELAAKGVIMP
jgi:uncharacterized protein